MRIIILDTYYQGFLNNFYLRNPDVIKEKYNQHLKFLIDASFGTSDYYSFYLNKLGHQASDVILNDEILQRKWAKENNIGVRTGGLLSKLQSLPFVYRFFGKPTWIQKIAIAQVKKYKPDVVYMQDLSILNPSTLKQIKKHCKLLVGQIACPLPPKNNLKEFQLILTSFPHYVKKFRDVGINSEYLKIGFDKRVLERIGKTKKIYDVTFVGSFSPYHLEGTKVLEEVARKISINIWGQGIEFLSPTSPLRKNYHGEAWGIDMYKILAQSKIVLNRHISAADGYANNMRLYESTGMGALLVTDKKKNLNDLFNVGKEVVEYVNSRDLVKKIKLYLSKPGELNKIASAGQKRTLVDHNYKNRMKEILVILKKYL
jgi:spore maturation protein CgeB